MIAGFLAECNKIAEKSELQACNSLSLAPHAFTMASPTTTCPIGVDVRVRVIIGMTLGAAGDKGPMSTTTRIFLIGHRFKMSRINAWRITTKMIEL